MIWDHGSEDHLLDPLAPPSLGNLAPAYWAWREKGMRAPHAVRYPPGFGKMGLCVGSFVEASPGEFQGPLGYIASRRALYVPLYCRLAKAHPRFRQLRQRLARGEKLLIVEVDGPHEESLDYYREKYDVSESFIERGTVAATLESLTILLDDDLHPFGHGYCLAAALLGLDEELLGPRVVEEPPTEESRPIAIPDDDLIWADLGL